MRAQPSKARYFAIGEPEAWREARRLSLVESQPVGAARVEFRNPPHSASQSPPLLRRASNATQCSGPNGAAIELHQHPEDLTVQRDALHWIERIGLSLSSSLVDG
jgi:hypothetical protein